MGAKMWVALAGYYSNGIHWKANTDVILGYFKTSTGQDWTRDNARKISWCTYFAHWALVQAGVSPLPQVGTYDALKAHGGAVGRFLKRSEKELNSKAIKDTGQTINGVYNYYAVASKTYQPKPGDLYYLPKQNNHVGIIVGAQGDQIWTVDGNSGPKPGWDARFFFTMMGKTVISRIGDGFIYYSGSPKKLGRDDFYIEIPD